MRGLSRGIWSCYHGPAATFDRLLNLLRALARNAHGLERMIQRCGTDNDEWRDIDGDGMHDEVQEVHDALWHCAHEIYGAYDYYCVLHSNDENAKGEPDVFNITFNSYLEFIRSAIAIAMR